MTTYYEILNAALALPLDERSELLNELRDSMTMGGRDSAPPQFGPAFEQLLARRSAEIDAGTASYVTWEQMQERARRAAGFDG